MRVLIVGAGPTGLTIAVELARRSIIPAVIDRRADASSLSRAVGITPRSLTLLEPSGVTERLLAKGVKIREARVHVGEKPVARLKFDAVHSPYDYILGLAQDRTEAVLRDALTGYGGAVTFGSELVGLRQEPDRVVAVTADGKEAAYDIIVGADGIGSTVRPAAGIHFPGFDLPQTWSVADVDAENWVNAGAFTLCFKPHGAVVVAVPLEAQRFRLISNTPDALAALPIPMHVTRVRRRGTFTISVRQAETYQSGRVYLAGDAAHCHSPVGGRGMNLGIADGTDLARRLVEGDRRGYESARRGDAAATIALSERARRIVTSDLPFSRPLLSCAFRLVGALPPLRRKFSEAVLLD